MRVVGGRLGGRRLTGPGKGDPAAALRPTADRVRESLFSVLAGGHFGDPLQGAAVLDLFAGTGALGIEALSRGAADAIFVEDGRRSLEILGRNIADLGLGEVATVLRRDARRPPPLSGAPRTLVFLDPPYGRGLGAAVLTAWAGSGWIAPGAVVVWEEAAPQEPPDGFAAQETRRYGDTVVSLMTRL